MKFAIIAAGEGSRLQKEGITLPKPLLPLQGRHMIDRLIHTFDAVSPSDIVVSVRGNINGPVAQHLQHIARQREAQGLSCLSIVCGNPPDSMHSFALLRDAIGNEPFVLTTVDTVFSIHDFRLYIKAFQEALRNGLDGLMAVTDFIHDEKPLHVQVDSEMNITAFLDDLAGAVPRYISGGIYALSPAIFPILDQCLATGVHRMRNFQRALIQNGLHLRAHAFSKIIDVDHVDDIPLAEAYLHRCEHVLCLSRAPRYAPSNTDGPIINAVAQTLRHLGLTAEIIDEDAFCQAPEAHSNCRAVLSMARDSETINALEALTNDGVDVPNAPKGVATCNNRCQLARHMQALAIPTPLQTILQFPDTAAIPAVCATVPTAHYPLWLKSGDHPVTSAADVTFIENPAQLASHLSQLITLGTTSAVAEQHVVGTHVKFYAVANRFFHICQPETEGVATKFDLDTHNATDRFASFDTKALQADIVRLSSSLDVPICGGDAIVRPDGHYFIIDFNDWPSFRPCIQQAAQAIAQLILQPS